MVEEIEIKNEELKEVIDAMKDMCRKIYKNTNDIKLVGIEFHFLIDDEIQYKCGIFSEGYDPSEFEHDDEE